MTDNDFSYGGTNYTINGVLLNTLNGNLILAVKTGLSTAAKRLTFKVGDSTFNIADGTLQASDKQVLWANSGLSWTAGDSVSLKLVEPADTAPGKPTGLSASANGTTQIDLSWTAPTDNGGEAISGYKVEVSSDGGSTWSDLEDDTESTTTTHSHTGLSASATRHYRVSAINSVGTGAASDTASATTATATAPGKPTGLSASRNGGTQIDLSWTAPTDNGGEAISGYRVEVSSDAGTTFSDLEDDTESTSTTYSHTGLSASTTRHYRISAITSVGTGPASDTANATTAADDTLPTISSAAVTGSEVTLSFSEALDTASRPAESAFTLTAASGGVTRTIPGKTSRVELFGTSAAVSLVASVSKGEELTLSYTAPATNPLQDTAGNDMASFSGMFVQNANTTTQRPAGFSADTASFSIAEDHADAATVGTVTASDADGDTLTYSLASGGDNDSFTIASGTGVIKVKSGVRLDHEAKASHSLTA